MSLLKEAADKHKSHQLTQDLRTGYEDILEAHGQTIQFGYNIPPKIRGAARFIRGLWLKATPNPSGISLEDRLSFKTLHKTVQYNGESVVIRVRSETANVKASEWIGTGVTDTAEALFLFRKKPAVLQEKTPMGTMRTEPFLYELEKYAEVLKVLERNVRITENKAQQHD